MRARGPPGGTAGEVPRACAWNPAGAAVRGGGRALLGTSAWALLQWRRKPSTPLKPPPLWPPGCLQPGMEQNVRVVESCPAGRAPEPAPVRLAPAAGPRGLRAGRGGDGESARESSDSKNSDATGLEDRSLPEPPSPGAVQPREASASAMLAAAEPPARRLRMASEGGRVFFGASGTTTFQGHIGLVRSRRGREWVSTRGTCAAGCASASSSGSTPSGDSSRASNRLGERGIPAAERAAPVEADAVRRGRAQTLPDAAAEPWTRRAAAREGPAAPAADDDGTDESGGVWSMSLRGPSAAARWRFRPRLCGGRTTGTVQDESAPARVVTPAAARGMDAAPAKAASEAPRRREAAARGAAAATD